MLNATKDVMTDHATPRATSALACVMASAWQRMFQLHCNTIQDALSGGAAFGRSAAALPASVAGKIGNAMSGASISPTGGVAGMAGVFGAMPGLGGGVPPAPDFEPVLRYASSMLDICRSSSDAAFELMRAQLLGERDTVEELADAALRDFASASADAAQAARDTLSASLSTVSSLTAAAADNATRMTQQATSEAAQQGRARA